MSLLKQTQFGQDQEWDSKAILRRFEQVRGWDQRYREIIKFGKLLPIMSESQRQIASQVKGCDSEAWLLAEQDEQGCYWFGLDSNSRIVKGLMAILLAAGNGKSASELAEFDWDQYFDQLGLINHLSPSRGNGLRAIARAMSQAGA